MNKYAYQTRIICEKYSHPLSCWQSQSISWATLGASQARRNGHDNHILATLSLSQWIRQAYPCHTFTFSIDTISISLPHFHFLMTSISLPNYHFFTTSISLPYFNFLWQVYLCDTFTFAGNAVSPVSKNSVMIQDRKSRLLLDWREKGGENSWLIRLVDGVNGVRDTKEN